MANKVVLAAVAATAGAYALYESQKDVAEVDEEQRAQKVEIAQKDYAKKLDEMGAKRAAQQRGATAS
jgi:hypothetical protein